MYALYCVSITVLLGTKILDGKFMIFKCPRIAKHQNKPRMNTISMVIPWNPWSIVPGLPQGYEGPILLKPMSAELVCIYGVSYRN